MVKKAAYHGHALDVEAMAKELGYLQWYIAGMASCLGLSLSAIQEANIEKLRRRYPEGFSTVDSIKRVDVGEETNA